MAVPVGIAGSQVFVLEQTSVARYVALAQTAGGITLPDASRNPQLEFFPLAFPGLTEAPAVIFFRTRFTGTPSFTVLLNNAVIIQYTFTAADPPERSWHHIILPNLPGSDGPTLKTQGNDLIFGVEIQDGADTVTFGDIVVLYTSNELTIKTPVVVAVKEQ